MMQATLPRAPQLKLASPIDQLLQWAYLHELPKRRTSSAEGIWDRLKQYGSLGGIGPDTTRNHAQRYAHFGLPHPDAERIEKAVNALQPTATNWPEYFDLLVWELAPLVAIGDLQSSRLAAPNQASFANAADGRGVTAHAPRDVLLVNSINVEALVYSHAIKGTRPNGWRTNEMRPVPTAAERGPLAKIIGICKGKNSYSSGSYCPLRWEPSPIRVVMARANYLAWWQALAGLAKSLELTEHLALPPQASPAPWIEGETRQCVYSISPLSGRPLPLKPARKLAGPAVARKRDKGRRIVVGE